jgi:hypothetical protein
MPDIATLGLRVDSSGAIRDLQNFDRAVDNTATKAEANAKRLANIARGMGLATIGVSVAILKRTIEETIEAQRVTAQLEAVIKSTGGVAGRTSKQIDEMATALQRTTTFSDDAIKSGQALLLTFTKIRGAEFDAATRAMLDMAQAMGGDLRGAALQLGKALNDPAQGLTALTRSGVSFSESQKRVIQQMVETGRVAEAQKLILAELQVQFGGSAEAARNTLGGAIAGLKNAFGDLFEETERNTGANTRFLNTLTRILEKAKEIREANQLRFFPDHAGVISRELENIGNVRIPYSGGNTVIRASVTEAELEAAAEAKKAAARAALARATEAAANQERLYADALRFSAEQAAKVLPLAVQIYKALYEQQEAMRQSLGLTTVGTNAVQDIKLRGGFDNLVDQKILDRFTKNVSGMADVLRIASQTIEYAIVQRLGGGTLAGNFGASVGKAAISNLPAHTFGASAMGQALFAPIAAGIGAAFGGAIESIFDFSGRAKEAAQELKRVRQAMADTIAEFRATAFGTSGSVEGQIAAVQRQAARFRAEAESTFDRTGPGRHGQADRAALAAALKDINESEAEYIRRLKEEHALKQQMAREDLQVRLLIAGGHDDEAAALRQRLKDEQELAELIKLGIDENIIRATQEAEARKRESDKARAAADKAREAVEELWEKMEDFARATGQMNFDASSRIFGALGRTREAEDLQTGFNAQREMEEAIKAGMTPATLAMLALAHVLEREALVTQRAIEDQTKAV